MTSASLQVPYEPFFTEIFGHWQKGPEATLIRDRSHYQREFSVTEFLYHVLTLREGLRASLDEDIQKRLQDREREDVYIAILANPDYSFAVLFFAIYSLGAVVVPMSPEILAEEAKYMLSLCNATLITSGPAVAQHAQFISTSSGIPLFIFDAEDSPRPGNINYTLDTQDNTEITSDTGFVLIWSSGTSGRPKGILHSRQAAAIGLRSQVETLGLSPIDTWLNYSPLHWGAGCTLLIATIISGSCSELCKPLFNPDWILERLQDHDATCIYLPPVALDTVAERLGQLKNTWSQKRYAATLRGLRHLRLVCTGATHVNVSCLVTWKDLRDGKPPMVVYAMTESLSLVATTDWSSDSILPQGCCGTPPSNMTVKVDSAGEICLKSSALFRRYISNNPTVMEGIHDSEGFFKTGDIGRLEGDNVFVLGRASQDIIHSVRSKVHAVELEAVLCSHPLVSQAIVLGIPDTKYRAQVAALVVMKETSGDGELSLSNLRKWLAVDKGIALFKLPTILRTLSPEQVQVIPVTGSGKPIKGKIRELLFNEEALSSGLIQTFDLETEGVEFSSRPFDWTGLHANPTSITGL